MRGGRQLFRDFSIFFLLAIFFIFVPLSTNAVSISKTTSEIIFYPNYIDRLQITLSNEEPIDYDVSVKKSGPLEDFITLKRTNFILEKNSSFTYDYLVNLPDSINTPGYKNNILEFSIIKNNEVREVLEHSFNVYVPVRGKAIDDFLTIEYDDEVVSLILKTHNIGESDINDLEVSIELFTLNGDLIGQQTSQEKNFRTNKVQLHKFSFPRKEFYLSDGEYRLKTKILFDELESLKEEKVEIGTPSLNILNLLRTRYIIDDIVQFDFEIENNWNKEARNIFGNVIIYDAKGSEIDEFKTQIESIAAYDKSIVSAYWNRAADKDILVGDYNAAVNFNYGGRISSKKFDIEFVDTDPLRSLKSEKVTEIVAYFAQRTSSLAEKIKSALNTFRSNTVLVYVSIFLLILIVAYILYVLGKFSVRVYRKRKGEHIVESDFVPSSKKGPGEVETEEDLLETSLGFEEKKETEIPKKKKEPFENILEKFRIEEEKRGEEVKSLLADLNKKRVKTKKIKEGKKKKDLSKFIEEKKQAVEFFRYDLDLLKSISQKIKQGFSDEDIMIIYSHKGHTKALIRSYIKRAKKVIK